MSSDSFATVRADLGEPPVKRQKTFNYGYVRGDRLLKTVADLVASRPDVVVLRSDTTEDGTGTEEYLETVAVVNATTFHRATEDRFKDSQASMTHYGKKIADVNMNVIIFTKESESVIRVLAQWVNEGEMNEPVLKACARDGLSEEGWVVLLIGVIEFWLRNKLDESVHDRLIDCLIDWLQSVKNQGSDVKNAITAVRNAVEDNLPWARIPELKTTSHIVELLACLILYYDDRSLGPFDRDAYYEENELYPDINDKAYTYLLAGWKDKSKVRQDPLDDDFNQHCRYHLHGDNERCYRQKQS